MAHPHQEIEIKLPLQDAASGRRLLRRAGFRVSRRRVFEENTVFDTPGLALRSQGSLLRVRTAGRKATLTYKSRGEAAKYKSREELETAIPDAAMIAAILGRLGFAPVFRYEKYRTEYSTGEGAGVAMLDETPVGIYLELEGSPEWIDGAARLLGFGDSDYITASYARLYTDWCRRQGSTPSNMVFDRQS